MLIARASLAIVGTLAGLTIAPSVKLRPDAVDIPVPPGELLAHFQDRLAGSEDEVLARDGSTLVRRFSGQAGPFPYRTVEVVTFEADGITFEHLSGPFSFCHERFALEPIAAGTRVIHTGSFRLRGGIWTAPLALTAVRRAFEAHVREHLLELGELLGDG